MKIKNTIILFWATLAITGCNDGFMSRFPEAINDETFWNTTEDLKTYANQFYGHLPAGLNSTSDGESDNQVPNNKPSFFWDQAPVPESGGNWSKGDWEPIRNLNYFMTHYEKAVGTEAEINIYVAEIRFFRAFHYGGKIRTFGDVPWLEKELTTADTTLLYGDKMKRHLVLDKIIEDFDFAIEWLPEKPEAGRLSKDVARHLKARTCLHEACYYKYHTELGLTDKANKLFELAAKAANDIIETGKYEIYTTGNPDSDFHSLFLIEDKSGLKEAILPVEFKKDVRMHNISRSLYEARTGFSKDFVNSFLCTDGKPISISNEYLGDKTIKDETTNRDPRLKQTVLTPDFPRRITGDKIEYTPEENLVTQYCYTGYNVIKYFSPKAEDFEANACTYDGIAYRYAETLLMYAEAKAELGTISQADLDKTINVLRDRVGMPHLSLNVGFTDPNWPEWGYALSPLLQEIRRERRVELGGEGMRWDDLMRWKAGHICDQIETYLGKWVPETTDGEGNIVKGHYAEVYVGFTGTRKWNDRLYLRPIPTGELLMNPKLKPQNPGWK